MISLALEGVRRPSSKSHHRGCGAIQSLLCNVDATAQQDRRPGYGEAGVALLEAPSAPHKLKRQSRWHLGGDKPSPERLKLLQKIGEGLQLTHALGCHLLNANPGQMLMVWARLVATRISQARTSHSGAEVDAVHLIPIRSLEPRKETHRSETGVESQKNSNRAQRGKSCFFSSAVQQRPTGHGRAPGCPFLRCAKGQEKRGSG